MNSKYSNLYNWFAAQNSDELVLTFKQVEDILGFPLCPTAYKDRAYWCNHETETLAKNWLPAGYLSYDVNLETQVAHFRKDDPESIKRGSNKHHIIRREDIKTPSNEEIDYWLKKWDELDKYVVQEKALKKLFLGSMKENDVLENVLTKCCLLNIFYSTNIFNIEPMAKHIYKMNIDERLKYCDESLVDEIAKCPYYKHYEYSFATKYCSHHNSDFYPIYDSYVDKMLKYFRNVDHFDDFADSDLKNYHKFRCILLNFIEFYELNCNLKDLDRYLWQAGKKYFKKTIGF